jgi:hypothetical protein
MTPKHSIAGPAASILILPISGKRGLLKRSQSGRELWIAVRKKVTGWAKKGL